MNLTSFATVKSIILTVIIMTLVSCDYELSPWHTDVYCPGRTVDENLVWLKQIERSKTVGSPFKVAVLGDPQQFPGDLELVIQRINKNPHIDFILLLGDIAETGVKPEFEWACAALNKTQKPIIPVIGNHDALSFGKEIWRNIFGEFDFSFSYLGTKFIAYNDNQYEFEDVPNRDWLSTEAQVEDGEVRLHTIGMSHIPPWGRDPDLDHYLADQGYNLMLHAHLHRFDYRPNQNVGLPQFVTADTQEVKFAVLTISENQIAIEQCEPECFEIVTNTYNP